MTTGELLCPLENARTRTNAHASCIRIVVLSAFFCRFRCATSCELRSEHFLVGKNMQLASNRCSTIAKTALCSLAGPPAAFALCISVSLTSCATAFAACRLKKTFGFEAAYFAMSFCRFRCAFFSNSMAEHFCSASNAARVKYIWQNNVSSRQTVVQTWSKQFRYHQQVRLQRSRYVCHFH
jgi:hypothetical protein